MTELSVSILVVVAIPAQTKRKAVLAHRTPKTSIAANESRSIRAIRHIRGPEFPNSLFRLNLRML